MGMQFEASSPQHVYRDPSLVGWRGFFLYMPLIAGIIVGSGALWYTFTVVEPLPLYATLVIIAVYALGSGFLVGLVITRMREKCLVTSPEGIAYAGRGFRIFTPWENVAGMAVYGTDRGSHQLSGLVLHQPAPIYEVHTRFPMARLDRNLIAISDVTRDWQQGALAEEIRHYAPQGLIETSRKARV